MCSVKELLNEVVECEREPWRAGDVLRKLLSAIENYASCDFGTEQEQPSLRMAVLAEIRNFFSEPAYAEALADIDPDEDVNVALLENAGMNGGDRGPFKPAYRIKPPFCNDRYTHKFVDEWYAERRYAIGTYGSIVVQLPSAEAEGPRTPPNPVHRFVSWWFAQGVVMDTIVLVCLLLGWLLQFLGLWWAGAVYPLALLVGVGVWSYLWRTRGAHVLKALVPRLAACVLVGLALPLATQEAWTFSFRLWKHQWGFWSLVIALLSASWLYLFVETHDHIEKDRLSAWRAFHILLRLCNFALFFSWWATTLMATLHPTFIAQPIPTVCGLQTASVVCLLFAAFAVFIGIFLQVLWHERPITSRL